MNFLSKNHNKTILYLLIIVLAASLFTACPVIPPGPEEPTDPPATPVPGQDEYEPDNTYQQAQILNIGTIQYHTLHDEADLDYMMFEATAGTEYIIETFSPEDNTDTILFLFDTDGTTLIDSNDDNNVKEKKITEPVYQKNKDAKHKVKTPKKTKSLQSTITWTCTEEGTYYLCVSGFFGDTGRYSILLLSDSSTPTPTPIPGNQVTWCGYTWTDDMSGHWSIQGDNYVMAGTGTDIFSYSTTDDLFSNFYMEVDVRKTVGDVSYSYGIFFGGTDPENCYLFFISADGYYSLWNISGGSVTALIFWEESVTLNTGLGAWNTLGVNVSGNTITLYANSVILNSYTDSSYSTGKIGLQAFDHESSPYTLIQYRNFSITGTTTTPPTAEPTTAPTAAPGGDEYEPDNTWEQAHEIMENDEQDHTLHNSQDFDYMMFQATAGSHYTIETFSPYDNTDTILYLYDTDGTNQLAYNDDNDRNGKEKIDVYSTRKKRNTRSLQSTITWDCPVDGTYYIRVIGYSGDTGSYSVLLLDTTPLPTETPGPTQTPVPGSGNWTVMVYMDADNNLEPYGIADMNEMEGVDLSGSGVNVIVLMDRISGYDSSNGNWTDTRLFEINYDSSGAANTTLVSTELASTELGLTIEGTEELNLGDPAVCSSFIDFCKTQYTADNYLLIYWNHGSGWKNKTGGVKKTCEETLPLVPKPIPEHTRAVCFDDTNNDTLYTQEIGATIAGKGITVIGFDACLEGMIEVAYEVRNDASYMIASEEVEGADGWEYNYWLQGLINSGQTPVDLVTEIVDSYAARYSSMTGATLSAIDLSQVQTLMGALNIFSDALYNSITNATIRTNIASTLFLNVEDFCDTSSYTGDLNIDIWDMAEVIYDTYDYADQEAINLMNAVDNAVVAEWHHPGTGPSGNPRAHGIAIHLIYMSGGTPYGHDFTYMNGYTWAHPLAFVSNTTWNMYYNNGETTGPGLLYRLWYESF